MRVRSVCVCVCVCQVICTHALTFLHTRVYMCIYIYIHAYAYVRFVLQPHSPACAFRRHVHPIFTGINMANNSVLICQVERARNFKFVLLKRRN